MCTERSMVCRRAAYWRPIKQETHLSTEAAARESTMPGDFMHTVVITILQHGCISRNTPHAQAVRAVTKSMR